MLENTSTHRSLRPNASSHTSCTPRLWRNAQVQRYGQIHAPIALSHQAQNARDVVVYNTQPYGRGQPPSQPQQPMALVRRPAFEPPQAQQAIVVNLSDVADKQLITRNRGQNLGTIGEAWVDPINLEVVSFDIEPKRGATTSTVSNVPLTALWQIGDVVLIQDENLNVQQRLDSRFGLVKLLGMEVRTRSNKLLGKVRDIAFSPDTGAISKIEFDDFGLRFLPVNFFDTYSIPAECIDRCDVGAVIVFTDEWLQPEKQGFLSSILRGVSSRQQVAGLLSDGSRFSSDSSLGGQLPKGYTYEQWQNDVRRWEEETGYTYEDYQRQLLQQQQLPQQLQQQQQMYGGAARRGAPQPAQPRNALPPPRQQMQIQQQPQQQLQPLPARQQQQQGQQPGRYALPPAAAPGSSSRMPPQRNAPPSGPQGGQQSGLYGSQQQQQPPLYGSGGYGGSAPADPRYRGTAPVAGGSGPVRQRYGSPAAGVQQPQQQQWPGQQQPPASPQQQPQQQQWAGQQPGMTQGSVQPLPQQQQQQPVVGGPPRAPMQQPQQQQSPPQQQPPQPAQQQQPGRVQPPQPGGAPYGWPAASSPSTSSPSFPAGGPGAPAMGSMGPMQGAGAADPGAPQGATAPPAAAAGSGGGALRVDEWLAREQ
ncbi:hypothetical protein Agub_g9557, partial [Astrephomene gubernaculifera]